MGHAAGGGVIKVSTKSGQAHSLGETLADIGQGDVAWVVMADPDGNEFCVLTAR